MAKGDHIYVSLFFDGNPLTHHGIDCGDGTVIEYQGYFQRGKISRIPKKDFGSGRTIQVKEYGKVDSPPEVIKRAESKLGKDGYCLFSNNCEHFAYWCKTGKHKSEQVNNVGFSVAGAVPISVGPKIATKAATKAALKAANPFTKGLIKIGLKQAPKVAGRAAVGIASTGGVVTGFAADIILEKILEDDEHLPQDEREARASGRRAGQVASTVGVIGGSIAAGMLGGTVAVAGAVAAPAVLGIGIGLGAYHLTKGNKSNENSSSNESQDKPRDIEIS